ncbi:MAG TPA: HAMP domain-containing sensor histidine kinase [Phycisphaerae bacterium]|mgnify:CR=1 FL=1|nr:HAMP domain-containing sensor histidine kinase [Phycisphaerae bacterium]
MTLSRKLVWKTVALAASLIVLGGVSLGGLWRLRGDVYQAKDEYRELRIIQNVGIHVAASHAILSSETPNRDALDQHARAAIDGLERFLAFQEMQDNADPQEQAGEIEAATRALQPLRALLSALDAAKAGPGEWSGQRIRDHTEALADVLDSLEAMVVHMDQVVEQAYTLASAKLYRTIITTTAFSLVIIAVTILINVLQYRNIVNPLSRLREAAHRIAGGDFKCINEEMMGEAEFTELARDFNRMATELNSLYRDLEHKVRTKSKELVRSERLASVGYLAAGVAHEINNPLNIISGYAELTLRQLREPTDAAGIADLRRSLEIVRDEALRCKRIITQLLSLARMETAERRPLPMGDVVRDVASMVAALESARHCRIETRIDAADTLLVSANEAELKQVLLNLVVNALEAIKEPDGQVAIAARRRDDVVEVSVCDNGRGMTPEVLERVFEPFFTNRRGGDRRGAGLGLAITHAIIEAHGGCIRAESPGPGQGSRFVVELPAMQEVVRLDAAHA